jgi:hypothetical protein
MDNSRHPRQQANKIEKSLKMKKFFVIFMVLFSAKVAFANPVIVDPLGSISSVIVLGGAITVEACLATLLLLFFNMSVKPLFLALFFGNLVLYFMVFLPLLDLLPSLWMAEALIVAADGIMIKAISLCEMFQEMDFKGLKWKYAFLIGMLGNSVSYYVGAVIQG